MNKSSLLIQSNILKLALFATGLSGIVAEYILCTLATYFLGNSVLQWTMILSIMLFSMGLGSRLSKHINYHLLEKFIIVEFVLSVLVSFCAFFAYLALTYASFNDATLLIVWRFDGVVVYILSILIGLLIGMEIPLVTRLNEAFESLQVNISHVMEKDYYGSLLGGLFFAFVGLPFLGLTYTPFVLGAVNFLVAVLLFFRLKKLVATTYIHPIKTCMYLIFIVLILGFIFADDITDYGQQQRYKDKVILQEQTKYQQLVVTQWKDHYWFYINGNQQLSTLDEYLYHEPLVHPVMGLSKNPEQVLILGGGDGCAAREVLKYQSVKGVTLVDLDPRVTEIAQTNPIFTNMNKNSLNNPKVQLINTDAYAYMDQTISFYDVIIIDFPDPKSVQLGRLFSYEFYRLCYRHLRPEGLLIVQAGSPYYATKSFRCIEKTLQAAQFHTLPLHNQILTMGQWGWVIGTKNIDTKRLKKAVRNLPLNNIHTKWLNKEALYLITSFGKQFVDIDTMDIEVNTIHNPVLPRYYRKGNWDLY